MDRLRFGLLGTGYWALHAHGTALASSPHAKLVGVWGRDPSKAATLAKGLGASAYEDLEALFGDVDAVAISLPPDVQARLAVRAAQAGCHLLLDKPLALDVQEAESVAQAVDVARVAAVVFFTARFRPEVEAWLDEAARSGPWHAAHLAHYANIFGAGSPFGGSAWRRDRGALWDFGPHALATLIPVLGPVSSVVARRGFPGTDTVHLLLTHASGATSLASLSLTMPPAAATSHVTLYGDRGVSVRPEGHFDAAGALRNAIAELAGLVESGQREHRCDVHFGAGVVQVLACAETALSLPGADVASAGVPGG
jgi:predicted dehydrogenase